MDCSTRCIACTKSQIYKIKGDYHGMCEYHRCNGSIKCNMCSYVISISEFEVIDKEVQGYGTIKSLCSMHNIEYRDYCTVCQNQSLEAVNTLRKSSTFHEMPHECINTVCREIEASNINHADPQNPSDENLCNFCYKTGILRKLPCTHIICESCFFESQLCNVCQLQSSLSYNILANRQPQPKIYHANNISIIKEPDIIDSNIPEEQKADINKRSSDSESSSDDENEEEIISLDKKTIVSDKEIIDSDKEVIVSDKEVIVSDKEVIDPDKNKNKINDQEIEDINERYKLNNKPKSGSTSNPEENSNQPSPEKSSKKNKCCQKCCSII